MMTDTELTDMMNTWFEHYSKNGESHYSDTKPERIIEIYYDKVVDRVLGELPEMDETETQAIIDRMNKLF